MKPRYNPFLTHLTLAASIVICLGQAASAADYYWDTTSGSWGDGANWSDNATSGGTTGVVPLAADSVFFNQSSVNGAEIISLDAARAITGITFNNTGATAITSGFGANLLTLGTGGLTIASGAGAVTLNTGIRLSDNQAWTNNSTTNPLFVSSTISNVGDLAPYTLNIGGAGNTQLNGIISNGGVTGTTALVKSGLGTLTLGTITGVANTFSGGTTINANSGTVIVSNAAAAGLGSGAISIGTGSTLQVNGNTRINNSAAFANTITGTGTLKLFLGPNQVAGGFTVAGATGFTGTIQIANNGANGSTGDKFVPGSGFTASGATLQIDSGSQLYTQSSGGATFGAINVSGNGGSEGRGAIRAEGALVGNITLNGSTSITGNGSIISGSITGTATGGNTQILTLGAVSQDSGNTLSGVISDGVGTGKLGLTKRRGGTTTLSGAAVNTYTGDTTVNGGILLANLNNLATPTNLISSNSKLVLGGGTISITGKSAAVASSQTFASTTLNSGNNSATTTLGTGGTSTTLALQAITRNTGALFNHTNAPTATLITTTTGINGAALPGSTSYFGAWGTVGTGAGTRYLQLDSSGRFVAGPAATAATVSTAANVTSNSTVYSLANGTYTAGGNLSSYALLSNNASTTTFALGTNTLTTNGYLGIAAGTTTFTQTGAGGNVVVGADNELVINTAQGNVTFSVPIANKPANSSNVTIGGAGVVTLNTVASTYTGTTTVNSGTLTLGLANVINSASSLVMNGGTVGISTFDQSLAGVKITGGAITGSGGILTSASTYDIQSSGTISAILAGNVGLNKTTDFNAALSGANTFTGDVNIKAGQLSIATSANATPLGNVANNVYLGDTSGIDYAALSFSNTINLANPITVQSGSSGAKTITAAGTSFVGTVSGNITLNDDLYLWPNSSNGLTLSGSTISLGSKSINITQASSSSTAFTLSGTATGASGSVNILGSGTGTSIFSSTDSTYGGGTVLGGNGTVRIDASSTGSITSGPFGTGSVTLNGAAVNAGITADQSIANAITIAENTTFATQATETSLTFSGATTLANGDRTLTVNLGATVAGKGVTFSNAIGDSGQGLGLTKAGTGLLTLSGSNTYSGATTLTAGKTQIGVGNVGSLGSITSSAIGTGTLIFNGGTLSSDSTTARTILNTVNFTGNAVLGDATNNGKLTFSANADLGTAPRTITTNSEVQFDGILSGALGGVNKAGAGTLNLTNANTYTGVTTITSGILNVANLTDYGVDGALGNRASVTEAPTNIGIRFMGGTLQYTGSTAQSTDRQIRIGANTTNTIDASGTGTGTVTFAYSGANTDLFDTAGTRTLTLTGSNVGDNTFAIRLENQAASATSLIKSGAGKWVLTSANSTYTGATSIQSGTLQVDSGGSMGGATGALSMGTGSAGVIGTVGNLTLNEDVTKAAFTVQSNTSDSTTSTNINQLSIASTKTLTVSSMTVGVSQGATSNAINTALATGASNTGGTLSVTGDVTVGLSSGGSTGGGIPTTVADLSGLANFNAGSVNTNVFRVGYGGLNKATLTLASTSNTINVGTISVGETTSSQNSSQDNILNLGIGSNALQANNIQIGTQKASGVIQFADTSLGSVSITGFGGGAAKANITLGNNSAATWFPGSLGNQLLLAGHTATVQAGTVIIGQKSGGGGGLVTSAVTFDTGTFGADNIQMALINNAAAANGVTSNFTVGGATANSAATGVVNVSGNIILAGNTVTNATPSTSTGTLTINGGTVNVNTLAVATGGIFDTTTSGNGFSTTTLTLEGGTLDLNGGVIGGTTGTGKKNIGTLNFRSGTLKNVLEINGGASALTKTTAGTLILDGTNSYTGATTVPAGILNIANNNALNGTSGVAVTTTTNSTSGGALELANGVTVTGKSLTISGYGGASVRGSLRAATGASAEWAGGVVIGGAGSPTDTRVGAMANGILTISGAIVDGTLNTLTISGENAASATPGKVIVSGTSNTYTGQTQIIRGILAIGANNALPTGTVLNVHAASSVTDAALFDLNGYNQQVAGLTRGHNSGAATVSNTGGTTKTLTINNAADYTYDSAITGNLALTKDGAAKQTLSGTNTYTGATNVNAGVLAIDTTGTINTTSAINVAGGATLIYNSSTSLAVSPTLNGAGTGSRAVLGGTGTINAAVTLDNLGDTLSPGNSPGIQPYAVNQTWSSFSYDWELNSFTDAPAAGTNFDQLGINGSLTLTGGAPGSYVLNLLSLTAGNVTGAVDAFTNADRSWTIGTTTSASSAFDIASWTINDTSFRALNAGLDGTFNLQQSGNDLVLNFVAVPEPSAALLAALGLLALLRRRRRA